MTDYELRRSSALDRTLESHFHASADVHPEDLTTSNSSCAPQRTRQNQTSTLLTLVAALIFSSGANACEEDVVLDPAHQTTTTTTTTSTTSSSTTTTTLNDDEFLEEFPIDIEEWEDQELIDAFEDEDLVLRRLTSSESQSQKAITIPSALIDSDSDGLSDYEEFLHGTDPLNPDTDGDGYLDGAEIIWDLNPNDPADGFIQYIEADRLTGSIKAEFDEANDNIEHVDSDRDGISDAEELFLGLDPRDPDQDKNGIIDGLVLPRIDHQSQR